MSNNSIEQLRPNIAETEPIDLSNCWKIEDECGFPGRDGDIMVEGDWLTSINDLSRYDPTDEYKNCLSVIHDAVGLVRGEFQYAQAYGLAIKELELGARFLVAPGTEELSRATSEIVEGVRARREADFHAQLEVLNSMVDSSVDTIWVKLIPNDREDYSYFAAQLKGFFIFDDEEGQPRPGLFVAGKDGRVGTIPGKAYQFGAYK